MNNTNESLDYASTDFSSPLCWSDASLIFAPHPFEPSVTARHTSCSKDFVLPRPDIISNSPHAFAPPTVISVAPQSHWLFAYFPGREKDGLGCVWNRDFALNVWTVRQTWDFTPGSGIITALWLPPRNHREWAFNTSGGSYRLPRRGPIPPVSDPTLLLVTQNNELKVCYMRNYFRHLLMLTCRLAHTGVSTEAKPQLDDPIINKQNPVRLCTHAAIYLTHYDTLLVATHSLKFSENPQDLSPLPTDPDVLMDSLPPDPIPPWDLWGPERTVEMAQITFNFDSLFLGVYVQALEPIPLNHHSLTRLAFMDVPSELDKVFLATSFSDFQVPPTSHLQVHSLLRRVDDPSSKAIRWSSFLVSEKTFARTALLFVDHLRDLQRIFLCTVDRSGNVSSSPSSKRSKIGRIVTLNFPALEQDIQYEPLDLAIPGSSVFGSPIYFACSPNRVTLCALSSSISGSSMTLQALPRNKTTSELVKGPIAMSLISATLNQCSLDDVAHEIVKGRLSDSHVLQVLQLCLTHKYPAYMTSRIAWEILGATLCIYRLRTLSRTASHSPTYQLDKLRWQNLRDVCSLISCHTAFAECGDVPDPQLDLESVWSLIEISGWFVGYLEKLLTECIYDQSPNPENPDISGDQVPPILVYAAQPFVLRILTSLLRKVLNFRATLASKPGGIETAHLARLALSDILDCPGINLANLEALLTHRLPFADELPKPEAQAMLLSQQLSPKVIKYLHHVMAELNSSRIVDKARLVIKPNDMVDGLQFDNPGKLKGKQKDIVSKGIMSSDMPTRQCVRCGGRSRVPMFNSGDAQPSHLWPRFELRFSSRCICGGLWMNT